MECSQTVGGFSRNLTIFSQQTSEGDKLARQYGDGRFIRDLTLAVIMELERRGKEAKYNEAI